MPRNHRIARCATQRMHAAAMMLGLAVGLSAGMPAMAAPGDAGGPERAKLPTATDSSLSPATEALIAQLSSSSYAERQSATEQLLGDETIPLGALETALARPGMVGEARARLLQVARQAFYKSPRAALGVQFDRVLRDRVVVGKTFDKFPAHKVLEPGDIIIQAEGVKLRGPMGQLILPAIIVSHDPGQTLKLVVRRGDQKLELDAPLGLFSDLEQAGLLPEDRLSRAWRVRAARLAQGHGSSPLRPDVEASSWLRRDGMDPNLIVGGNVFVRPMREAQEGAPQVAGGGVARQAGVLEDEQRMVTQIVIIGGQRQVIQVPRARQFVDEIEGFGPAMTPQQELTELTRQRAALAGEAARLRGIEDLPLTDPARVRAEETLRTVRSLERQTKAIQAELAEEATRTAPGAASAPTDAVKD